VSYKSGVSIALEEHLPIYLFSALNSILPAARAPLHSRAVDRVSFRPPFNSYKLPMCTPCTPVLQPVHYYCPATPFDLGSFECGVFGVCNARYIMDARRTLAWGHDYKWPLSPSTTCSCVGYPSWTLKGHLLEFTSTNDLQVLL